MTLEQMMEDLPKVCDIGVKRNARGHQESWTGYKLHIDAIDGGIPVSCLLTSASVHDSQAAIPLARLTASRVDSLYDLMDSAYDAPEIRAFSQKLGHAPIIDLNPRRRPQVKAERKREALAQRCIGHVSPEASRHPVSGRRSIRQVATAPTSSMCQRAGCVRPSIDLPGHALICSGVIFWSSYCPPMFEVTVSALDPVEHRL